MFQLRLNIIMVLLTCAMFTIALVINEWLFKSFQFLPGINWIYLPAGVRLLSMLMFGEAGAVGLLIISWAAGFFLFFPDDFIRAFMGGIIASLAPYLIYRIAQTRYGLQISLANLTPRRLSICILLYAIASPLLHHIWFFFNHVKGDLIESFFIMFVGDLTGSVLVIYALKLFLSIPVFFRFLKSFRNS